MDGELCRGVWEGKQVSARWEADRGREKRVVQRKKLWEGRNEDAKKRRPKKDREEESKERRRRRKRKGACYMREEVSKTRLLGDKEAPSARN